MAVRGKHVVIVGGTGGIGQAFTENLVMRSDVDSISATCHNTEPAIKHTKMSWYKVDLTNEAEIKSWMDELQEVDWLINAAGILHTAQQGPEKSIGQFDPEFFMQNIMLNAMPCALLAKHGMEKFKHGRPAVFTTISAKVGSIEDNYLGGWVSYRSSKAALNMILKTIALEWRRALPNVVVVALHPGTTDTSLSKPFQANVSASQLFTPQQSVSYMLNVILKLKSGDSGKFLAFDGEVLPW